MLDWTTTQQNQQQIHHLQIVDTSEHQLREAAEACAKKAISLLDKNIQDNSLYLLFEWNQAQLTIVVTDSSKTLDSPHVVKGDFSGLAVELQRHTPEQIADYEENLKFWLHDFLASYAEFFRYSLVAIFHSSTRDQTELL